jgi:hypothetical protein
LLWLIADLSASTWTLGWIFSISVMNVIGILMELWWACRSLLVVQSFLLRWFYQSMSMRDRSIFCSLLWFLSLMVCGFLIELIHIIC